MKTNTLFKCVECDYEFETTLDSIRSKKTGCKKCKSSNGERQIMNYLEYLHELKLINNFKKEFKFVKGECDIKKPLMFDFIVYVDQYISFIIEYDGIQHFDSNIIFGGGINNFDYTRKSDIIKTKYCIEKNIQLLRISYLDTDNINSIIGNYILYLKKHWSENKSLPKNCVEFSDQETYLDLIFDIDYDPDSN